MTAFRLRTVFSQPLNGQGPPFRSDSGSIFRRYRGHALLALFIAALAVLLWSRYLEKEAQRAVELRLELQQIRTAVSAYITRHGEPPPDLIELAKTGLIFPGSGQIPLLDKALFDEGGAMKDPYGYPYIYNPLAGTVYSSAPCCRNW